MQALAELTLTRPWHWGIAVLGDPSGDVPDGDGDLVTVGSSVLVLIVRHAQDVGGPFEGEWDWATASLRVRVLSAPEPTVRPVLCDVVLVVNDYFSIGDADGEVLLSAPGPRTRVIVSAEDPDPTGLNQVWIDLVAEAPS